MASIHAFMLLRLFLGLYVDGFAAFELTREGSRLAGHILCGLHILWLWAGVHLWGRSAIDWLTTGLLPLLGRSVWALRTLRGHGRLWVCAWGIVCVLLRDAERCCTSGLLHIRVVLRRLRRRRRVGRVRVLLVGSGSSWGHAAGGWRDVLVMGRVLPAAHEEECGQADECKTNKGPNDSAGNPCFALAPAV
jgi:hypothetical protein